MGFTAHRLCDGVDCLTLPDSRFKTAQVTVGLFLPLSRETVEEYALLPRLLTRACAAYPDFTALNRRLNELYGAAVTGQVTRVGEAQGLIFTAECTGDDAHHRSHPHGIAHGKRFLNTYHTEQSQAHRVKHKEQCLTPYQQVAKQDYRHERQGRNGKIPPLHHPEHRNVKQKVAQRTATYGGHQAHDIGSEPVKIFGGGKADAAYGKRHRTHHLYYKQKSIFHL